MEILRLIEIALAGWYISNAVTNTHGPGGVFEWIREHVWHGRTRYADGALMHGYTVIREDIKQVHNGLLDCIICLMPWMCLILWLVPDGIIVWAFASAGLALLLHGYTNWRYNG